MRLQGRKAGTLGGQSQPLRSRAGRPDSAPSLVSWEKLRSEGSAAPFQARMRVPSAVPL